MECRDGLLRLLTWPLLAQVRQLGSEATHQRLDQTPGLLTPGLGPLLSPTLPLITKGSHGEDSEGVVPELSEQRRANFTQSWAASLRSCPSRHPEVLK